MIITKKQLRKIIKEQLQLVPVGSIETTADEPMVIGHGGKASMAKSQLFNIAGKAQSLNDKLDDADELPEWVQSKIAVMSDNMDSVADFLQYRIHRQKTGE